MAATVLPAPSKALQHQCRTATAPTLLQQTRAGGFAILLTSIAAPWLCSTTLEDRAARAPSTELLQVLHKRKDVALITPSSSPQPSPVPPHTRGWLHAMKARAGP